MNCRTCGQPVRFSAAGTSYAGWVHLDANFDTHKVVLAGEVAGPVSFTPRCRGCGAVIEDGQVARVTVTHAQHVITVNSHEHHRQASHAAALEDLLWQRDQSHYGGETGKRKG